MIGFSFFDLPVEDFFFCRQYSWRIVLCHCGKYQSEKEIGTYLFLEEAKQHYVVLIGVGDS
jgi:hypothetical protein